MPIDELPNLLGDDAFKTLRGLNLRSVLSRAEWLPVPTHGQHLGMTETQNPSEHDSEDKASGRDRATESEPTDSGHSTADSHEERNREDESPG